METPSNPSNKQKAGEAPAAADTQALQVVPNAPLTSLFGTTTTTTPRSTDPAADTPRVTMQPEVVVPEQVDPTLVMPNNLLPRQETYHLNGSFREFRSLFLHQFASSRKHRKTELSLFSLRQKEGESLKDYLLRFNTATLEVPSVTQEVKASAFAQGLMDGDFFKSLAKKPATKFDVLLAQAAKYINMEDAQASKREGRGEKRKENKDENSSNKPRMDFKDKKPAWQRLNMVYTP
ncbi:UNVERIFIED_CONTAM: hypothetical protein Slati_0920200 [Sesamum latifolium]|uniref:Retrotransposon gag domain-containing protein n=1 Tax=Sesamum latifolium TaxID=2727402 RepID=A0AAW2XQI1_9LAMI